MVLLPLQLYSLTTKTSTGGTSSSPLNWSNSGSWNSSGSGTPMVYIIRSGDYIQFDANNSSPYVDSVYIYGNLILVNNKVMTLNSTGVLQLMNSTATISGGSNNTQFQWNGTSAVLTGPFTSSNIVTNGPRYATASSVIAASGNIQSSFVAGILPIILAEWEIKNTGDLLSFSWHATLESNEVLFVIKHSTDLNNWYEVLQLNANADSLNPGWYECSIPKNKIQNFREKGNYFVLDILAAGEPIYRSSPIHFQNTDLDKSSILNINITSNPASEDPLVEVYSINSGVVELNICTLSGATIKQCHLNFEENVIHQTMILRDINPGTYILRASIANISTSMKLVRQ